MAANLQKQTSQRGSTFSRPISVAIVEDDPGLRDTLLDLIAGASGLECVIACGSGEEALERIPPLRPNVVLMDVNLPGMSGILCTCHLHQVLPAAGILMLTVNRADHEIFQALEAGASGYLLKGSPADEILDAIRELHRGGSPMTTAIARRVIQSFQARGVDKRSIADLTPRESQILELLSQGFSYKEIGSQLGISPETVRTHLRSIYDKLHVRTRGEAVARYLGAR